MKLSKLIELLTIITLLFGLTGQIAHAQIQADIFLETVKVHLLPEYTQPNVLVIYEIELDASLPLPQKMTFSIPADAKIFRIINFTSEDRLLELTYQATRIGNWKDIQITPSAQRIRIEYQDPNLVRDRNQRIFEFQWLSIYSVKNLSVFVRQPIGVGEIRTEPFLSPSADPEDSDRVVTSEFGEIPAGELFTLTLSYSKDSGELAYPALAVVPAQTINENTPGITPPPIFVILWLMVAGVAVIILLLLYYLRFRRKETQKLALMGQGVGIMNPERQISFCHECGIRSRAGDSYCSNCGTELRKQSQFEQPF